jgi:hypothetical protein
VLCLLQLCRVSHCFITLIALHCVCPLMLGCWQNFITPRPPTAAHFTAYLAWFACGITSFVAAWLFIRTVVSIGKMVRRLVPCVLCLVSGVLCLESGVWCLVYGVWCLVCGVWCLVSGVWCLVSGVWCLVSGVWCLVSCVWSLGVLYVVSVVLCPGGCLLSVDGDVPNVYRAVHSISAWHYCTPCALHPGQALPSSVFLPWYGPHAVQEVYVPIEKWGPSSITKLSHKAMLPAAKKCAALAKQLSGDATDEEKSKALFALRTLFTDFLVGGAIAVTVGRCAVFVFALIPPPPPTPHTLKPNNEQPYCEPCPIMRSRCSCSLLLWLDARRGTPCNNTIHTLAYFCNPVVCVCW